MPQAASHIRLMTHVAASHYEKGADEAIKPFRVGGPLAGQPEMTSTGSRSRSADKRRFLT